MLYLSPPPMGVITCIARTILTSCPSYRAHSFLSFYSFFGWLVADRAKNKEIVVPPRGVQEESFRCRVPDLPAHRSLTQSKSKFLNLRPLNTARNTWELSHLLHRPSQFLVFHLSNCLLNLFNFCRPTTSSVLRDRKGARHPNLREQIPIGSCRLGALSLQPPTQSSPCPIPHFHQQQRDTVTGTARQLVRRRRRNLRAFLLLRREAETKLFIPLPFSLFTTHERREAKVN